MRTGEIALRPVIHYEAKPSGKQGHKTIVVGVHLGQGYFETAEVLLVPVREGTCPRPLGYIRPIQESAIVAEIVERLERLA